MQSKTLALKWALVVLVALLGAAIVYLAPAMTDPEHLDTGIMIGEKAPVDLPMRDAAGEPTTIAEISGESGTVLVLVRSADWCPFCAAQIKDHAAIAGKLSEKGFTLASLSYDEPELLGEFAADYEIPHPMLSDTDWNFVRKTDLRDPQYEEGHKAYGVPYATVLVLAPDGEVLNKLVSDDYRQRPDNEFVLAMVDEVSR